MSHLTLDLLDDSHCIQPQAVTLTTCNRLWQTVSYLAVYVRVYVPRVIQYSSMLWIFNDPGMLFHGGRESEKRIIVRRSRRPGQASAFSIQWDRSRVCMWLRNKNGNSIIRTCKTWELPNCDKSAFKRRNTDDPWSTCQLWNQLQGRRRKAGVLLKRKWVKTRECK